MLNNNTIIAGIRSDNALATILANFDSNYIINMVKDSIQMRFRPYETALPSLFSIETSFQAVINNSDSSNIESIMKVREQTYIEIINEVCEYYGLEFNRDFNADIYSSAFWIYDFFVSNFTNYLFSFLQNYIYTNKTSLYRYMGLDSKKDKDSSSIYAKKIIADPQLALLHANLGSVLDNIFVFDITFEELVNYSFGNEKEDIKQFLLNIVKDINGTIFKEKYAPLYYTPYRTDIITNIKLKIQDACILQQQLLSNV